MSEDTVRQKLFPFSLKEKVKTWLHPLHLRSISTWNDMMKEFIKKKSFHTIRQTPSGSRL
ncbi:hypothetical protein PJP14_29625 [Mycobacterium kansasii]